MIVRRSRTGCHVRHDGIEEDDGCDVSVEGARDVEALTLVDVRDEAGHPVAAEGFADDVDRVGGELREHRGEEGVEEGVEVGGCVVHGGWAGGVGGGGEADP